MARSLVRLIGKTPLLAALLAATAAAQTMSWRALDNDGLHDPQSPSLSVLQNPGEALKALPGDTAGNKVDWIRALTDGYIRPRSGLVDDKKVEILDLDIILNQKGGTPLVRFPHRAHTQWLDCENCHDKLFESKAGTTPVTMLKILQGEYCGVCHGAVAFPLTECNRCHSVPRGK